MKMVKSLLLVAAAGIVAVPGAQAADLPVKAKPVEYVKICSLYGAGFYYIPGTDICLKLGGYARYQAGAGYGSSMSNSPFNAAAGFNNRINDNDFLQRARVYFTVDTRQQTAYGTLRTYFNLGFSQDTNAGPTTAPGNYANRAFIQLAGFTLGKATSYFDFASTAAVSYQGANINSDTGDAGVIGAWYTAQLGNGVSASFGVEHSKNVGVLYLGNGTAATGQTAFTAAGFATGAYAATDNNSVTGTAAAGGISTAPDYVGNVRIDQAWGSAQVSGVARQVRAGYYGVTPVAAATAAIPQEGNGYPGEKIGWGVAGGLKVNTPMFGPGDYFQGMIIYTEGAFGYAANTPFRGAAGGGLYLLSFSGGNAAFGLSQDAVFGGGAASVGTGNSLELTTAWSVFASYEHFWTPSLRTSVYGSYLGVSYTATASLQLCNALIAGGNLTAGTTCNTDWQSWGIGTRSQWNITKDFYVGLDVLYNKLETMTFNPTAAAAAAGGPIIGPGGASGKNGFYNAADQNQTTVVFRAHRDFVP